MQICKEIKNVKRTKCTKNWTQSLDAAIPLVTDFNCIEIDNS